MKLKNAGCIIVCERHVVLIGMIIPVMASWKIYTGLWTGVGGGEGVQGVSVFSIIFGSFLPIFFGFHYK